MLYKSLLISLLAPLILFFGVSYSFKSESIIFINDSSTSIQSSLVSSFISSTPESVYQLKEFLKSKDASKRFRESVDVEAFYESKEIKFSETNKISILSFGSMLSLSNEVSNDLEANLIDMRFVKPLDTACIIKCASHSELLVTLEDNVIAGGAGSAINEFIAEEDIKVKTINFGISDHFPSIGGISEQREDYHLDKNKIVKKIKDRLSE